ncbi:GATA transcription factor 5-like [Prosopis cineraria]|uniref:GATA transcription factor 5-like n=1 Tax=Prosopis cineraria TaxID=364024 RepID=UPI00240F7AF6|nr:GATA transcription factor 5-like [Prosopis cineraria]XP_054787052.1 GATA transcription factor 5-like [Prosopis cineraria]
MEFAAAKALKPSLRRELSFQQKTFCDEVLCLNGSNGVSGEDFSVDDLLDLSHDEFQHVLAEKENDFEDDDEKKDGSFVSDDVNSNSSSDTGTGDSESGFASELAVPADDLADLEWVSHFVDDSLLEFSYPVYSEQLKAEKHFATELRLDLTTAKTPRFPFKIPAKTRSTKYRKANARVWSSSFILFVSRSPPKSSSALVFAGQPPAMKQKKRKLMEGETSGSQIQRRCSHCHVQKTPQWRTGPLGAKTLCNACGVRFKSGRLFPEYRPACSPTFSSDLHSNSHRKVLEIRRKKEMVGPEAGLIQTQMVHSF